ncbi:hypothetical protein GMRT_15522 [Giardia muris]|uniref:Uncharacterized protein n=1 Tax=Giardia muris TaxID=5742 RepID=A0A4Z1T9L6_GIAMU|nr:hypothetical protein GMRT_15522 [Giardia muris]|eukprot:TNJ29847.1 hypothetical protein GMRT_15522 [Giardia muris]
MSTQRLELEAQRIGRVERLEQILAHLRTKRSLLLDECRDAEMRKERLTTKLNQAREELAANERDTMLKDDAIIRHCSKEQRAKESILASVRQETADLTRLMASHSKSLTEEMSNARRTKEEMTEEKTKMAILARDRQYQLRYSLSELQTLQTEAEELARMVDEQLKSLRRTILTKLITISSDEDLIMGVRQALNLTEDEVISLARPLSDTVDISLTDVADLMRSKTMDTPTKDSVLSPRRLSQYVTRVLDDDLYCQKLLESTGEKQTRRAPSQRKQRGSKPKVQPKPVGTRSTSSKASRAKRIDSTTTATAATLQSLMEQRTALQAELQNLVAQTASNGRSAATLRRQIGELTHEIAALSNYV